MGQYFKIVNTTKKQFIDIASLGESNKLSFIGRGLNGIILGRLLTSGGNGFTDQFYRKYGDPKNDEFYMGAWAGDSIVIAGDYDQPDCNGISASYADDTDLNLYQKVESDHEFNDVTDKVIEWLAKDDETADMLAEQGIHNKELLSKLSDLVFVKKYTHIEESLIRAFGADWTKKLKITKT